MDIWWTLHLKRDLASVPLARRILLGTMETAGVDPQIAYDLGVALTEACANAVEHAVGGGRPDDSFQVTASMEGDRLRIEVTDSGPGLPATSHLVPARRPSGAPPARALTRGGPRTRRGRASLPPPGALGPTRRTRPADRPAPYDTHVLPAGRPVPAGPRPAELDTQPDLYAESGRGLFLIRALTDHVQLRNHPQRGAIVSFDKVLKWRHDTPVLQAAS